MDTIICINPGCRATLNSHSEQGAYPDAGGGMADVADVTLCLYCGTLIVVDRGGVPRPPTAAERAAVEASDGYRKAVAMRRLFRFILAVRPSVQTRQRQPYLL